MEFNLSTREADISSGFDPVTCHLGGVRIYSKDEESLTNTLGQFSVEVKEVYSDHILISGRNLRYYLKTNKGLDIPQRLFSALVGREMRIGNLDRIICESINGKKFFIFVHVDRVEDFKAFMRESVEYLTKGRAVNITEVRDKFFPEQKWNSWVTTSYFFSRLVFFGLAKQLDKFTFKINSGIGDANLQNSEHLYTAIN